MKKLIALLSFAMCCLCSGVSAQQVIVSGHGNKNINIIDIPSNKIVWKQPLLEKEFCNSIALLEGGRLIAYSTQLNAKVVDLKKKVVFEYKASAPGKSEVHSVVPMRGGGFAVFEAGATSKIIVFSKTFAKLKEITFDGGTPNKHGQFRQAILSRKNTWLIPCFPTKEIREYDMDGIQIDTYPVGERVFGIKEGADGTFYLGLGDGHKYAQYNPKKKEYIKQFEALKGMEDKLYFVYNAQYDQVDKDVYMVANWGGHRKKGGPVGLQEPQVIMFDAEDKILWQWDDKTKKEKLGMVSAFFYSKKPIVK